MNGVIALDDEQAEAFRSLESHRGAIAVGKYRKLSSTKELLKPPTQVINNWMRNSARRREPRPHLTSRLKD